MTLLMQPFQIRAVGCFLMCDTATKVVQSEYLLAPSLVVLWGMVRYSTFNLVSTYACFQKWVFFLSTLCTHELWYLQIELKSTFMLTHSFTHSRDLKRFFQLCSLLTCLKKCQQTSICSLEVTQTMSVQIIIHGDDSWQH